MKSLVERSSEDIAAAVNALSTKVNKVEEVTRAGVSTLNIYEAGRLKRNIPQNLVINICEA